MRVEQVETAVGVGHFHGEAVETGEVWPWCVQVAALGGELQSTGFRGRNQLDFDRIALGVRHVEGAFGL